MARTFECKLLVQVVLRDTCAIAALVRSEGRLRNSRTGGDSIGRAFFVLRERLREIVRNDARPGFAVRRSRDPALRPDSFSTAALRT